MSLKKVADCSSYRIKHQDKFFLDANILINILDTHYAEKGKKDKELIDKTQTFLKRIGEKGAKIIIIPLLISECINTYSRQRYSKYKQEHGDIDYKLFRKTSAYKNEIDLLNIQFNMLIENDLLVFDGYSISKEELSEYFKQSKVLDFNDFVYGKFVKQKGLIFVTNDKDFMNSVSELSCVLSFNQTLINKRY